MSRKQRFWLAVSLSLVVVQPYYALAGEVGVIVGELTLFAILIAFILSD